MMIRLFSSRQPAVFVLLVLLIFPLRLPFLIFHTAINDDITAYTFFGDFFQRINQNEFWVYMGGSIIIALQTLHLNHIFEKHRVHYKSTFLPSLFYVIYASLFNAMDAAITPSLLVQSIVMAVLGIYFDLYKSVDIKNRVFTAMFLLGMGSLLYFPLTYFIPAFLISLFFIKIPSFRDFVVALSGVFLPLYFAFVFFYYTGRFDYFTEKARLISHFTTSVHFQESIAQQSLMMVLGILILWSSVKLYYNHFKNIIKTRIIQQMLLAFSLIAFAVLAFLLQFGYQHLLFFSVPFSYLLSYLFLGKWKFKMDEILAAGIIIFVLVLKIYQL